jgi:hypothetical protein
MTMTQLITWLEALEPNASPCERAEWLFLLVQDCQGELSCYENPEAVLARLKPLRLQWQWTLDQEAAVADELDQLASTHPAEFSPKHVWTLIRAIKVQKQIIGFYRPVAWATIPSGAGP